MTPHLLTLVLWAIQSAGEATLAVVLLRGAYRRWPFLFALMVFDLCHTALKVWLFCNYDAFFYSYWIGEGIRSLISMGLLYDVLKSLPALKYLPRRIGLTMASFAGVVTAGSVYLAYAQPSKLPPLVDSIQRIQGCADLAWVALAACLLGCISSLGLGWMLEALNVTSGFIIQGLTAVIANPLISSWPAHGRVIEMCHNSIDLLVLSYWIHSLCRPSLCPDCSNSDNALASLNQLCKESLLV